MFTVPAVLDRPAGLLDPCATLDADEDDPVFTGTAVLEVYRTQVAAATVSTGKAPPRRS